MAIRVHVDDECGKTIHLYIVVAYAPTSNASVTEYEEYNTQLDMCIAACEEREVLIMGADVNASLGGRNDHDKGDNVLGKWAGGKLNEKGKDLHDWCVSNDLTAPLSFFQHREYNTWVHPRSKSGYRLDQWLVRRRDFKRIADARVKRGLGVCSDHLPILLKLKIAVKLASTAPIGPKLPLRHHLLREASTREQFRKSVLENSLKAPTPSSAVDAFERVKAALQKGGEMLRGREKESPPWFRKAESVLLPLIERRQKAQKYYDANPLCAKAKEGLKECKNIITKEIRKAKHNWQAHRYDGVSPGQPPGAIWKNIKDLRAGLSALKSADHAPWFKNKAGVKSKTNEQNNAAMKEHWGNLFNLPSTIDEKVLDKVRQRPVIVEMGALPSDKEIIKYTRKAKKDRAAGDNGIPIEFWQALLPDKDLEGASELELGCFALYRDIIHKSWNSEACPDDWLVGRLKMLYKGKGDKDTLDNWRGIMLLDVVAKVVCAIISARLGDHVAGLEEQNGFRARRGTVDGLFGLKMVLNKRREHGLSSWVVYVDLVKAFDSVPRDGLYNMLSKLGVPVNLIDIIIKFHSNFIVKVRVGEADTEVESKVGVKQGDSLAPVLFSLYFQACMEILEGEWPFERANFRYNMDDKIMGRSYKSKKYSEFDFHRSLYADDGAFLLTSRVDVERAVPVIFRVLEAFGLTMHVGRGGKQAKTEAVFYPSAEKLKSPNPSDTSDLMVDGGTVSFTDKFKYLGSIIADNLKDDAECDARISAANKAFGAIKQQYFCVRGVETRAKRHAYEAIVLSLLFYGSESWVLSEKMAHKIKMFHRRCLRFMCGITVMSMQAKGVHHVDLEKRLGLPDVFSILAARRLQWLGHVFRMEEDRLPRRMLTAWVPVARPKGRPQLTYAHTIVRDLEKYNIGKEGWGEKAKDRVKWRALVKLIKGSPKKQKRFNRQNNKVDQGKSGGNYNNKGYSKARFCRFLYAKQKKKKVPAGAKKSVDLAIVNGQAG
jgi:hypothetical protein